MSAALTSFLLLFLATSFSHVWGYTLLPVHCPLMCNCNGNYSHADVACKNSHLTYIPHYPRLQLESNSIKVIHQDSLFGYDNLTSLTLDDNSIRTITQIAFAPVPYLKVLSLRANKISHIRSGTFDTLPNLQVLILQHNDIITEEPSLFQVCIVY